MELAPFTADEVAAHAKGYGMRFDDYVDCTDPILIPAHLYGQLVKWCEPFMLRRYEVQGAVTFHFNHAGLSIERAYVMGGNSMSLRTTCLMDSAEMLQQMQADYPDWTQFVTNRVGWWHLHPGYYSSLSVGDVEECRQVLRDVQAEDTYVLQLLMYAQAPGLGYELTGYFVGIKDVYRLPVRIMEEVDA